MDQQIGPYRLERQIGRGGMGEVYRAYDERLGRKVAVKHVRPDRSGDETIRLRLRREARAAARLGHPHIVQVFDILEEEEGDWIVMELVDGSTIAEMIAQGPLDLHTVLRVGRDVASALAYAHSQGFVHRDLKTENVMLSPVSGSKILDFGLAKRVLDSFQGGDMDGDAGESVTITEEGKLIGTARALSPEQARGSEASPASDLFAFGVFLYECLTAISPFRGANPLATLNKVYTVRQTPVSELRPEVPAELSGLVDQLLEKLPESRPLNADLVAERLAELLRIEESGSQPGARSTSLTAIDGLETSQDLATSGTLAMDSDSSDAATAQVSQRRSALIATVLVVSALAIFLWYRTGPFGAPSGVPTDGEISTVEAPNELPVKDAWKLYEDGRAELDRYYRPEAVERAIKNFQDAIAADPEHAASYAGLAKALHFQYFNKNDPSWLDQAHSAAQQSVRLGEHLLDARLTLASILTTRGDFDAAAAILDEVSRLNPDSAEAQFQKGRLWRAQSRFAEAEGSYRQAVALKPEGWNYHSALGSLLLNLGEYTAAEEAFRRAIALTPDNSFAYRNLAAALQYQGRYREGIEQIQRSLEIYPTSMAYSNLGVLYFSLGLYQDAISPFEKAVETGANNYLRWTNLGDAYRWAPGNEDQARAAYERAEQLLKKRLAESPDELILLSRLAPLLAKLDKTEEALEICRELQSNTLNASMWYSVTIAYEISGRRQEAMDTLSLALKNGYSPTEIDRDPELRSLRETVQFHRLIMPYQADLADQ